jgi:tetratricopeptide (TPR) repeat protein
MLDGLAEPGSNLRVTLAALANLKPEDKAIASAQAQLLAGDVRGATIALAERSNLVTESSESGPEAFFTVGASLALQGLWSDAAQAFRDGLTALEARGLGTAPVAAHFWFALGYCIYMADGGQITEEELACYEMAVKLDDQHHAAHTNLGVVLVALRRDFFNAERHYRAALRVDETQATAHFNLANLLKSRPGAPDVNSAEEHYRRALQLEPNYAAAHLNLGNLLYAYRRRYTEAEAEWRAALALQETEASAHVSLGLLLFDVRKDAMGAEQEYRRAIQLDPDLAAAHFNLAILLKNAHGDLVGAQRAYTRTVALAPNHAKAYNNLGKLLHEMGTDPRGAEAAYRRALELDPSNVIVRINLGDLLDSIGSEQAERADAASAPAERKAARMRAIAAFDDAAMQFLQAGRGQWADEAKTTAAQQRLLL